MDVEKENTARILADKPLLATSNWCRIGWHRWTKWIQKETYDISRADNKVGEARVYHRNCVHCDILGTKVVKVDIL